MVFLSAGFDSMTTPTQQLFDGVLLGDVVESMTGHDVNIERSPSHRADITGTHLTRCSHRTRAYAGHTLLGTAEIVWEGAATYYAALLKSRMKDYLKSQQAQPVIESYDPDKGILKRAFMLESSSGVLHVREQLFVHKIESLGKNHGNCDKKSEKTLGCFTKTVNRDCH